MAELLVCLAILIIGPALLCWCDRNARQMLRHSNRLELHRQTMRSLFAPLDHQPTGGAHYVRRKSDPDPAPKIERHDPMLGYLPAFLVAQAD